MQFSFSGVFVLRMWFWCVFLVCSWPHSANVVTSAGAVALCDGLVVALVTACFCRILQLFKIRRKSCAVICFKATSTYPKEQFPTQTFGDHTVHYGDTTVGVVKTLNTYGRCSSTVGSGGCGTELTFHVVEPCHTGHNHASSSSHQVCFLHPGSGNHRIKRFSWCQISNFLTSGQ